MGQHEDAQRIRRALDDPQGLCDDLELLGKFGRDWKRQAGRGVLILCPFEHEENTPSCGVTLGPDGTIRVFCFGCKRSGDAFHLIAAKMGLDVRRDFLTVLEHGAVLAKVPPPEARSSGYRPAPPPRRDPAPRPPAPARVEAPDDGVIDRVANELRELAPVTRSPEAMEYLRSRRLDRGPGRGWFALPSTFGRLDQLRRAIVEAIGTEAWLASGLACTVEGPHLGEFSRRWVGRLVIPWHAPNGAVQTFQGRALGEPRAGEGKYELPAGRAPRWPWGVADLHELAGGDTHVAFTEGAIDAASFNMLVRSLDYDCIAVAIPSAADWRDEWAQLARGRVALMALDHDAAGARATSTMRPALLRAATEVQDKIPVEGKDWNELWQAQATRAA